MPFYKFRPAKQWGKWNSRYFKHNYENKLKEPAPPVFTPEHITQSGVLIEDPNDVNFPRRVQREAVKINHPDWQRLRAEDHPLYKSSPCFYFDGSDPFAEGVSQALVLTKSINCGGIPNSLTEKVKPIVFPNENHILQQYILQSQTWDSSMDLLPKRIEKGKEWHRYDRVYGIPYLRRNSVLLENMLRLCNTLGPSHTDLLHRYNYRTGKLNFSYRRYEETICMNPAIHLTVLSSHPLPSIASDRDVKSSESAELVSIYPIKATIDLRKEHIYDEIASYPQADSIPKLNIHTLLISKDFNVQYPWSDNENAANAIIYAFSAAAAMAQRQFGRDVKVLPKPVLVQAIQCCANSFDFVVFQLNSLQLENDDGIKNMVWVDSGNKIFKLLNHWEDMREVAEFNPEVFRKFLAFILHNSAVLPNAGTK